MFSLATKIRVTGENRRGEKEVYLSDPKEKSICRLEKRDENDERETRRRRSNTYIHDTHLTILLKDEKSFKRIAVCNFSNNKIHLLLDRRKT